MKPLLHTLAVLALFLAPSIGHAGEPPLIGDGVALRVQQTELVCFETPCPNVEVVSIEGETTMVADVDISQLILEGEDSNAELLEKILDGKVLVHGFFVELPATFGPVQKLVVTNIAAEKITATLSNAGFACVQDPCPVSWSLLDNEGNMPSISAVDVVLLEKSEQEKEEMLHSTFSTYFVTGFVLADIGTNSQTFFVTTAFKSVSKRTKIF